jgi:hypothetical protein
MASQRSHTFPLCSCKETCDHYFLKRNKSKCTNPDDHAHTIVYTCKKGLCTFNCPISHSFYSGTLWYTLRERKKEQLNHEYIQRQYKISAYKSVLLPRGRVLGHINLDTYPDTPLT